VVGEAEMVSEDEFKRKWANAHPTREDDTVVISGGKRATLDEVRAYILDDLARRVAAGEQTQEFVDGYTDALDESIRIGSQEPVKSFLEANQDRHR
jgi:hypothetical protein